MPTAHPPSDARPDLSVNPVFTRQPMHIPRYRLPDGELDPGVAYQIVHDELMLDGNARLNLATFVTTWSEPQARMLMAESLDKNMIDKDEYPRTADLENRCVHMLADLLLDDLRRVLDRLRQQTAPARGPESASFVHGTRPR